MSWRAAKQLFREGTWRDFVLLFLKTLIFGAIGVCLFVLLVDPYGVVPFSLPIERRIVSISQRFMYPQIVRSGKFDSLIVGTSTSRLLDPNLLNGPFNTRFANLSMDSMTAWEQKTVIDFFARESRPPKVLVIGIDAAWCLPQADIRKFTTRGFPEWLYDANPWNDYLYLLNAATVEIAGRMVGNQLGLYPARIRNDGFGVFVPPESQYDLTRARANIWAPNAPRLRPDRLGPIVDGEARAALKFPALDWLDETLAALSTGTRKILAVVPVHIAAQPRPGTHDADVETECRARIAGIARKDGATMIDWRVASSLTREDSNYWDSLHDRLPIAHQVARDLAEAALTGRESEDGTYRILVR